MDQTAGRVLRARAVFARGSVGYEWEQPFAGCDVRARYLGARQWFHWGRVLGGEYAERVVCEHARDLVLATKDCGHSGAVGVVGWDGTRVHLSSVQNECQARHVVDDWTFDEFCHCRAVAGGQDKEPQPLD